MNRFTPILFGIAVALIISGCDPNPTLIQDHASYSDSIEKWQSDRLAGLKSKTGWLNLAGIYWLEEGSQTVGSDPSNDIVFPEKAPPFMGTLTLRGEQVWLLAHPDADLYFENEVVEELTLEADRSGDPSYVTHGDLAWYIMKRHTSLGIRLRDYKNPAIDGLDHIPTYPIDPDYVVAARLVPFEEVRTITVPTPFQDYSQDYLCPGELHFRLKGKKQTLLPFISGSDYFLILADETSGIETYGGGRFLYATPDSIGNVVLDFNKAYNPPCAVTEFAACPMPPRENHLSIRVEAGEKVITKH